MHLDQKPGGMCGGGEKYTVCNTSDASLKLQSTNCEDIPPTGRVAGDCQHPVSDDNSRSISSVYATVILYHFSTHTQLFQSALMFSRSISATPWSWLSVSLVATTLCSWRSCGKTRKFHAGDISF